MAPSPPPPMVVMVVVTVAVMVATVPREAMSRRAGSAVEPSIDDRRFIIECVRAHNFFRSMVNPPARNMLYMSWDKALALTAKAWGSNCWFEHNVHLRDEGRVHPTFTTVGENLWGGFLSSFNATAAVQAWYEEVHDYDFPTFTCQPGRVCGHYTQVVWDDSYKVGCAVHVCPSGMKDFPWMDRPDTTIFVCNYGPSGNFPRQPYSPGPSCAVCQDRCNNRLCRNQSLEEVREYPGWDPSFPLGSCESGCVAGIVLGALTVLIAVAGGVYGAARKRLARRARVGTAPPGQPGATQAPNGDGQGAAVGHKQ
ncbi:glioma pathogenesis-related protein 1 [Petromyzon marinus]|uniref:glioma pathogenesis-related protein 1 n=1 Tax=Petromyzon marinus TaxID=7757 RepID=UPI003F71B8C7